MSTLFS
jgi:hypothetical protein